MGNIVIRLRKIFCCYHNFSYGYFDFNVVLVAEKDSRIAGKNDQYSHKQLSAQFMGCSLTYFTIFFNV